MNPIAVYVHIPFCTVKCGYCDFNAYAGMHYLADEYLVALLADIDSWRETLAGREVTSIGFGGGTPSEVPAAHIAAVIDRVNALAPLVPGAEVTLEANPGTIGLGYLRDLRTAGVNRLSIGAQSFIPAELSFLDRIHSPEATVAAVAQARDAGFDNLNLDLIYGLPGQSIAEWEANVNAVLSCGTEHLSAYALTLEDGTPLAARVARGEVVLPGEDHLAALYEAASERFEAAGLQQYEVSNWAKPGFESRHNTTYWLARDYVGVGAGAHGFVAGERFDNIARPSAYIAAFGGNATSTHPGLADAYRPAGAAAMSDWLSLRLRMLDGFDPGDFRAAFDVDLHAVAGGALRLLVAADILADGGRVQLTQRGRLLHGEAVVQLYTALQDSVAATA